MNKNWAICIGINDYHRLQPLKYAVQDASSVRDFFLNEVNFEKVYYFSDDSPSIESPRGDMRSLPTYANLKYFFREWFQSKLLNVGDNFWFFFAGHGEIHEDHDYLLPIDVDPGDIEGTALRMSDIADSLRNCGADNTVLLVDACRDRGKRKGQGFGVEAQQGLITIYSCSPNKSSYEIEALQHGSFTYALLEGLRLQGANNCATVERLDQYLCSQVPALNERYGKPPQMPRTSVEPISKNHLILLPQQATRLQDVLMLKHDAQEAELNDDLEFAQQLWVRVLAASPADGGAIAAIGRIAVKQQVRQAESSALVSFIAEAEHLSEFSFKTVTLHENGVLATVRNAKSRMDLLDKHIELDMVSLTGGIFKMGSADSQNYNTEEPQHLVLIEPFLIGKYSITQAQWKVVATYPQVDSKLEIDPSCFQSATRPVEQISWDDAVEFCKRLSRHTGREYRLPSEAEWEYACRAGKTTPFAYGYALNASVANYSAASSFHDKTTSVGIFPSNAFGIYDMHGNVWEWTLDDWHDNYINAPTDGNAWFSSNPNTRRSLRGGCFDSDLVDCRSASRISIHHYIRHHRFGFRVACSATSSFS